MWFCLLFVWFTSVTVSSEGTTNIIAYTIDKAGNVSTGKGTATLKLDKTKPTISSITSTGTSESAARMTVNANDTGGSGIDQYKFYIGTSTTPKTTSTSKTASVTGLTRGASNTVNVIVTDKAGNESTRTSKAVATKLYTWDKYSYIAVYSGLLNSYDEFESEFPYSSDMDDRIMCWAQTSIIEFTGADFDYCYGYSRYGVVGSDRCFCLANNGTRQYCASMNGKCIVYCHANFSSGHSRCDWYYPNEWRLDWIFLLQFKSAKRLL